MMKKRILSAIIALVVMAPAMAQHYYIVGDSIVRYEEEDESTLGRMLQLQNDLSNFVFKDESLLQHRGASFRFLPSVKRTPGYGFSFGVGGAVSFYADKDDYQLRRSEVPLMVSVAFTKPFSYYIVSEPTFYFASNAIRLKAELSYRNWLEYYYGIGYELNHNSGYNKDEHTYESRTIKFKPNVQFRLGNDNLYGGLVADVWNEKVKNPALFVGNDRHYVELAGTDGAHSATGTGVGLSLDYDTRDVPNDAYRGIYLSTEAMIYTSALGGNTRYGSFTVDYRQYAQLFGRKQVLAWNITSNNVFGNNVPFMRYATVGGLNNFRGYYNYQYRNKSMLTMQVEYRYWLQVNDEAWGILLNRFGFAAWAGTGVMGKNLVKYEALLPQVGAGVRFALRDRLNFRFDVAYNTVDDDTMWYISFSESF